MNELKKIPLKRILSAKTESILIVSAVSLSTASLITELSLSISYLIYFFEQAETILGCSMNRIFENFASNMNEIGQYTVVLLRHFNAGTGEAIPVAYNSDAVFSDHAAVENMPMLILLSLIAVFFTVISSLSVIFSVCKKERRRFYSTLMVSGARKKLLEKCLFYEAIYYCAASIPAGIITGAAEISGIKLASQKIFQTVSSEYVVPEFPVDIKLHIISVLITVPFIVLAVCGFSKKAVKKLSIKTVVSDMKKSCNSDIGVCVFSAEPKSYRINGIEHHVAIRNFQSNILKYLQIIFMMIICINTVGDSMVMYDAVRGYNDFNSYTTDPALVSFVYSSEIYFGATAVVLSVLTMLSTFSSVSANINSNTGEYALMRSAGSSLKSILRAVRLEGCLCCFFSAIFSSFSFGIFYAAVQMIYREDMQVVFGNKGIIVAVAVISILLFVSLVAVTVTAEYRKIKRTDMIAVLKDLFY